MIPPMHCLLNQYQHVISKLKEAWSLNLVHTKMDIQIEGMNPTLHVRHGMGFTNSRIEEGCTFVHIQIDRVPPS